MKTLNIFKIFVTTNETLLVSMFLRTFSHLIVIPGILFSISLFFAKCAVAYIALISMAHIIRYELNPTKENKDRKDFWALAMAAIVFAFVGLFIAIILLSILLDGAYYV